MLTYANHVGLYSEETGFGGEALGNFPQGKTLKSLHQYIRFSACTHTQVSTHAHMRYFVKD